MKPQTNYVTAKAYAGQNQAILLSAKKEGNYQSDQWITFCQARDKGLKLVGAKGKGVQLVRFLSFAEKDENGDVIEDTKKTVPVKYFWVFNMDLVEKEESEKPTENTENTEDTEVKEESENIKNAKQIVETLKSVGINIRMLGAKKVIAVDNGILFKIGRNAKGVNGIKIIYNKGMDLFDIEYLKFNKKTGVKIKETSTMLYVDMLKNDIETNTGMYVTVPSVVGLNA